METLRLALEAIAEQEPQWLTAHAPSEWLHTYHASAGVAAAVFGLDGCSFQFPNARYGVCYA